jgi:hypothetical protein
LSGFRIGRAVVITDLLELVENPDFGSFVETPRCTPPLVLEYPDGGREINHQGDVIQQAIEMGWDLTVPAQRNDFYRLNKVKLHDLVVFFMNLGDLSRGYLMTRESDISITRRTFTADSIKSVSFLEVI